MPNIYSQNVPTFGTLSDVTIARHYQENLICPLMHQDQMHSRDFYWSSTEIPPLTPCNVSTPIVNELGSKELCENNNCKCEGKGINARAQFSSNSQDERKSEFDELLEVLSYVPSLPSRLQQRVRGNNVNFILIATSQDQDKSLRELENALGTVTSRAIPLTFNNENYGGLPGGPKVSHSVKQTVKKKYEEGFGIRKRKRNRNLEKKIFPGHSF